MSTKTKRKELTQNPTFPRGIIRLLQIKENGKNKLAVLKFGQNIMLLAKKWIRRGTETEEPELEGVINPGCLPKPKPSVPPPFAPTAYEDKRSERLDENFQEKRDSCLVL